MGSDKSEFFNSKFISSATRRVNPSWLRVKFFALIMVPVLVLSITFITIFYYQQKRINDAVALGRMNSQLSSMRDLIAFNIEEALSDLNFAHRLLAYTYSQKLPKQVAEKALTIFAQSKSGYDQIRLLSSDGKETIRINNHDNKIESVSADKLQDKSSRDYFKIIAKMPEGYVYISPLEYNMEFGAIEYPLKLVIRLATKIENSGDTNSPILVLNYLGNRMLDNAQRIIQSGKDRGIIFSIVNSKGDFLRSCTYNQYTGKLTHQTVTNNNFASDMPEIWKKIVNQDSGMLDTDIGTFCFLSIDPEAIDPSDLPYKTANIDNELTNKNDLYLILFRQKSYSNEATIELMKKLATFGLPALAILSILAWLYSSSLTQKLVLQDHIRKAAITDPLTGLHNRRFGMLMLEHEFARLKRSNDHKFSLFFIDINNLKGVNDNFGHTAGDNLIKTISTTLKDGLRNYDILCRTGGDEFMVALPNTPLVSGKQVLERLRSTVSSTHKGQYEPYGIDFAYGGIEYNPQEHQTEKDMLNQADAAMYEDKTRRKQGRGSEKA